MPAVRYRLLLVAALALPLAVGAAEPAAYGRYAPSQFSDAPVLVNWNSAEGRARLTRAAYAEDFWQLAHHYQPQANLLYCGIASSVMVLNALRAGQRPIPSQRPQEIAVPPAFGGGTLPYPLYAQASFLDEATEAVKPRAVIELRQPGAYDADSDSVLLLDVSGHLNPWLWVPLRDLYLAMHTLDGANYRGWVVVGEGEIGIGAIR